MNIQNNMVTAGLLGLLSAIALMSGCSPAMTQDEMAAAATKIEVVRGEGSGLFADIGIVSGAMFAFDSAELTEEGKETIAAYRKKLGPELAEVHLVLVVGHTDNTGDEGHNMRLSLARAESVGEHLAAVGVDPNLIETHGVGPHSPIASNDTREGRMKNRRVDIYGIAEMRALDRMEFPSAALFDSDSADLSDQGKAFLDQNIETARGLFSRANVVLVVGHTDDKWDDDHNMKLSKERAVSVRDYLVSRGVDSTKMVTTGMGEAMPIADNTTRAGRAANRRVQIVVLGRTIE